MSSDSPQSGGPPSSSSRPLPIRPVPSHLMTRSAFASFTSPSLTSTASEPTPQSSGKRHRFNVERIYEFEAPQFYDFTKQSDPERGHLDEHWFGTFHPIVCSCNILLPFRLEKTDTLQSRFQFHG